MNLDRELEVAVALAREAAALIRRYSGAGIGVDYKPGDEGPVTRADREASDLIVAGLTRAFPGDGVLSEEVPDDGGWRAAERVWMIDPLDGTSDFIRGLPGFAVMIGLVVGTEPLVGVVLQPSTGRLLTAAPGHPGERVEEDGRRQALQVSAVADLSAVRWVVSASHHSETIERVREQLGVTDEMKVGSVGLKLGLIAAAERDLYVNPASKTSLWDCAAPEAILRSAGGRLSDLAGGRIDYRGELKNRRGLVASNGAVHELVLERLRPMFPGGLPPG